MKKVMWIDTETTGLEVDKHGLREVAFIIEIDNVVKERLLLYIDTTTYKNEKYISKYVKDMMGVDEEELHKYPDSSAQLKQFIGFIGKYTILDAKNDNFTMAGFNVEFDFNFIEEWFKDGGEYLSFYRSFGYQKIDVLEFVRNLKYLDLFESENNKLETLCNHFGIEIDAHCALSDIEATKKLHELLARRYIKRP